jgi:hypothetical protein
MILIDRNNHIVVIKIKIFTADFQDISDLAKGKCELFTIRLNPMRERLLIGF